MVAEPSLFKRRRTRASSAARFISLSMRIVMIDILILSLENTRRQNRIDRQHCRLIQLWRLCQNLYFARLHCQAVFNLPHCSSADSLVDPQLRASTSTGSSCALGEQED